jgi:molecular chaperone Hsp33
MGPWGEGLLSILRAKGPTEEPGAQPYIGTVPLVTGHLAKDLTFYWVQSEQIPSSVGLAVNLGKDGRVASAGGFLVQVLPGASAQEVKAVENHIQEIESLAEEVARHENPIHVISRIFQDSAFAIVEERPLEFRCQCSRDRAERALSLVGAAELQSMLDEDGSAGVHCDFCTTTYKVDASRLREMIQA